MKRPETTVSPEEIERQYGFMHEIRLLPHRPETYFIVTYGCQMNAHDSEKLAGMLEEMGMTPALSREESDFVIFNTCCIRDNAERRALGNITWLKEVRKTRPNLMIAVCGCMIQEPGMAEKIMKQYRFVNLAFGTSNLHRFPELMLRALNSMESTVVVDDSEPVPEGLDVFADPGYSVLEMEDDYDLYEFELTFAEGETVKYIRVTALDDEVPELPEMGLFTITGCEGGEVNDLCPNLTLMISDNDPAEPSELGFAAAAITVDRSKTGLRVRVLRTGGKTYNVSKVVKIRTGEEDFAALQDVE